MPKPSCEALDGFSRWADLCAEDRFLPRKFGVDATVRLSLASPNDHETLPLISSMSRVLAYGHRAARMEHVGQKLARQIETRLHSYGDSKEIRGMARSSATRRLPEAGNCRSGYVAAHPGDG